MHYKHTSLHGDTVCHGEKCVGMQSDMSLVEHSELMSILSFFYIHDAIMNVRLNCSIVQDALSKGKVWPNFSGRKTAACRH